MCRCNLLTTLNTFPGLRTAPGSRKWYGEADSNRYPSPGALAVEPLDFHLGYARPIELLPLCIIRMPSALLYSYYY